MALLLAPYNDAMRLGMGFNSFTQQLCVNDAVRLAGGKQEIPTDKSLRPQYQPGLMTAPDGSNLDISQNVTWTAKFVDKMSEVTDSLNVSGSLQIKIEAIGGGGEASASFLDSNKFKESDINYFIQVRVTNQHLTAPDLTDFTPIPNVPSSEFNRVYGDSFISGFIEGGEFNALISIKLNDSSKTNQIKGSLKVDMNVYRLAKVSGEAAIDKQETQGGGDIKDATVTDWTLETLKRVAMEFPEHVMACPMRTQFFLSLNHLQRILIPSQRNPDQVHELEEFSTSRASKGLHWANYENAGVYSSALLDAYMDYKVMWRNIQQAAWEVENGQSALTVKDAPPDQYQQKTTTDPATDPNATQAAPQQAPAPVVPAQQALFDAPIPPNNLVPYKGNQFGLDTARRDCRFEMIKIVREVDAVAFDPRVACDPSRTWQYLSPAVFRMLLPTVTNVQKQKEAEAAAAAAKALEAAKEKENQNVSDDLATTKKKLQESETQLNQLKGENAKLHKEVDDAAAFKSQFEIRPVGPRAFSIHHIASGTFLTTGNTVTNGVDLTFGPFPTFFAFQDLKNGAAMIHIAEMPEYTLNIWGALMDNGAIVRGWNGTFKGENDKWYIKDFADHNI
ncbi:hypothetical protein C8J57DRAFT_1509577 [Mycena rebaudengoi]|nr:hypothetical protein C8J57DRAFT_1509577 [Mycena rebaudengoi]